MAYGKTIGAARGRRSAQTYASVGLETKVMSADSKQLISLLLQGAAAAIAQAKIHLKNNNIPERGAAISKAINIIESGLIASINTEEGGELATNLVNTYELICHHLLRANIHSNEESLTIAENMLKDISTAWSEITKNPEQAQ